MGAKRRQFLGLYWPLLAGAAITALACIFYVCEFGFSLSDKQSVWADLGNYLGGVVGPLLALITIFLVLETLRAQRDELALSREELKKSSEALTRQAEQFARKDRKDDLLANAKVVFEELKKVRGNQLNAVYTHRSPEQAQKVQGLAGNLMTLESIDDLLSRGSQVVDEMFFGDDARATSMANALRPLIALISELADILSEVDALSESYGTTNYYRRRVQDLVRVLCEKRYISNELMGSFDSVRAQPRTTS